MTRLAHGRGWRTGGRPGYTLVELLVATAIVSTVLAAAYGWAWNVGSLASTTDDRVQAATLASAVTRWVAGDVGASVAVLPPSAGHGPSVSLTLVHDHVDVAPESVVIVWDPARRVVWRNASGTYIADHVRDFHVGFSLDDGRTVDGAAMTSSDWGRVRVVNVSVTAEVGRASAVRSASAEVGCA